MKPTIPPASAPAKPVHDKVPKEEFQPGATYRISKNGIRLYNASVVKFHGGCWATVRVEEALDTSTAKYYTPGMEFDIKVAEYDVEQSTPTQAP